MICDDSLSIVVCPRHTWRGYWHIRLLHYCSKHNDHEGSFSFPKSICHVAAPFRHKLWTVRDFRMSFLLPLRCFKCCFQFCCAIFFLFDADQAAQQSDNGASTSVEVRKSQLQHSLLHVRQLHTLEGLEHNFVHPELLFLVLPEIVKAIVMSEKQKRNVWK